jgi:hypothetical protein
MSLWVQFVRLEEIEERGGGIVVYIRRMQRENNLNTRIRKKASKEFQGTHQIRQGHLSLQASRE